MKKSVVIIIGLIYGLSIVFVTLFGMKHKTFNEIIYVSQIEIIEEFASYAGITRYIDVAVDEDGTAQYQLVWKVYPENATQSDVNFIYDNQGGLVNIDENGLITFTSDGYNLSVTVQIKSAEGSNASDTIMVRFRH